jgi:hypothetical protein
LLARGCGDFLNKMKKCGSEYFNFFVVVTRVCHVDDASATSGVCIRCVNIISVANAQEQSQAVVLTGVTLHEMLHSPQLSHCRRLPDAPGRSRHVLVVALPARWAVCEQCVVSLQNLPQSSRRQNARLPLRDP